MNFDNVVAKVSQAQKSRKFLTPFTDENPAFSLEEAYRVQDTLLEQALGRGERISGYKMGLTSRAKQIDVGVYSCISGFLLESTSLSKGAPVNSGRFLQPRVEPEVAVILNREISPKEVNLSRIRSSVEWIGPAAEILDSRYENYRFKLPDVVADNTSAAAYILGSSNWLSDLEAIRLMGVQVKENGVIVDTGAPAATFGDPLLSVLELIQELGKRGKSLKPGQVVLTGGITAAPKLQVGGFYEIVWPGETISFRYV